MKLDSDAQAALESRADAVAERLGLMANPTRLLVLCALGDKELSVGALQDRLGISQSALSQHLAKLRAGGVVSTRREAQTIYYRVSDDQVKEMMAALYTTFCRPD